MYARESSAPGQAPQPMAAPVQPACAGPAAAAAGRTWTSQPCWARTSAVRLPTGPAPEMTAILGPLGAMLIAEKRRFGRLPASLPTQCAAGFELARAAAITAPAHTSG